MLHDVPGTKYTFLQKLRLFLVILQALPGFIMNRVSEYMLHIPTVSQWACYLEVQCCGRKDHRRKLQPDPTSTPSEPFF